VLDLGLLLDVPRQSSTIARLIVTQAGGAPVAVRIDAFGERIDALVQERQGILKGIPGINGTTRTSDGSVRLVLNLPELIG
jgi:two-component system chemotaxis sensor kinase CheA